MCICAMLYREIRFCGTEKARWILPLCFAFSVRLATAAIFSIEYPTDSDAEAVERIASSAAFLHKYGY